MHLTASQQDFSFSRRAKYGILLRYFLASWAGGFNKVTGRLAVDVQSGVSLCL